MRVARVSPLAIKHAASPRRDVHPIDLERADPALRRAIFARGRVLFDRSAGALRDLHARTVVEYLDDALGAPSTAADAFTLLARHGRVDGTLARRLVGAAGLRNLIVHQYADIELERVLRVVREDLDDLRRFVAALNARSGAPSV